MKEKEPLFPKELKEQLPELYTSKGLNAQALVKFYIPDSSWVWYGTEFDGEDTFFGYVIGQLPAFGYFSLSELQEIRGPLGCKVERDVHFEPIILRELRDCYEQKVSQPTNR